MRCVLYAFAIWVCLSVEGGVLYVDLSCMQGGCVLGKNIYIYIYIYSECVSLCV